MVDDRPRGRGPHAPRPAAHLRGARVAAVAVAAVAAFALTRKSEEERVAAVVAEVAPATLRIEARGGRDRAAGSAAAGCWIRTTSSFVTAAHVVNSGQRFYVDDAEATVVGVAPCEDLAVLRVAGGLRGRPLTLADGGPGRDGARVRLPRDRRGRRAGVLDPRRRLRRAHAVPRPGPRRPGATRTRSAPTPRSTPASRAARSSTSTAAWSASTRAARTPGSGDRPLQGANYAVAADRARAGARDAAPRALDRLDRRELRLPDRPRPRRARPAARTVGPGRRPRHRRGPRPGCATATTSSRVDGRPVGATLSGWCHAAAGVRSGQTAELELAAPDGRRRTVPVRFE